MTNSIAVFSVLATNWLAITIPQPEGKMLIGMDTSRPNSYEVGIVLSNRWCEVTVEGVTNKFLLSSEPLVQPGLLRQAPLWINGTLTNTSSGKLWIVPTIPSYRGN